MRRVRVFQSSAFRLALLFAVVFAVGAIALMATINIAVSQYARNTTDNALVDESQSLRAEARDRGSNALGQLIINRQRIVHGRHYIYLLVGEHGRPIAGGLPIAAAEVGWRDISVSEASEPDDPSDAPDTVRTYGVRLADGSILVVGRDISDLDELSAWLRLVTLCSGVGIMFLALGGGLLIGAIFLRRMDRVNQALQRIMDGGLDERVPAIGMGEEFGRLTGTMNRMLDRMQALMEGLRQVSTDIAHDLRTPLGQLRQHLDAMRNPRNPEALEGAIDGAVKQVDEVLTTFHALLRIGQIEGGAGRARFEVVNLSDVMERVQLAYETAAEDAGKSLNATIAPEIAVRGDPQLLTQVFANLLENALRHTRDGAEITMRLAILDGVVTAIVADNGPGIPAVERGQVLHRFYRLDSSRSTAGSGLGLSLVAAIVDLHGAELELCDNRPGLAVKLNFPAHSALGAR